MGLCGGPHQDQDHSPVLTVVVEDHSHLGSSAAEAGRVAAGTDQVRHEGRSSLGCDSWV